MKTIDLLVQELPALGGFPDGAVEAGFLCSNDTLYFVNKDGDCPSEWRISMNYEVEDRWVEVTSEQYEAALAAKNDGWIDWGGGECPVDTKTLVDIRLKVGFTYKSCHPGDYSWRHAGGGGDIIAYRLRKPQEVTEADDEADLNECIGQDVAPVWSGDGLPPAGCECEYQYKVHGSEWFPLECVAVDGKAVFGWSNNTPVALQSNTHNFRPTRSEADKKREAICDAIYGALTKAERQHNRSDEAEAVYDAIAAGEIPGVKLDD